MRFLGIDDRGQLAPGFVADVTVFEPETIIDKSTWSDPTANAVGVAHVLVNGEAVLLDGELTGAAPGRRLRKWQS
jgi:N-acyl-D-aspartate/D-glutamate deacylase